MLIIVDRHTKEDIAYWNELVQMDKINAKSSKLTNKEDKAIKDIQDFWQKHQNNCYAGVSWGKDSVVLAHLVCRANIPIPIVHIIQISTINENPYSQEIKDIFIAKYNIQYHELIADYSNLKQSLLTDDENIKQANKIFFNCFKQAEKQFGTKHMSGIRLSESAGRKIRMLKNGVETKNALAPIGYWSTNDVFAYLDKYDLPIHPNYGMLGAGIWDRNHIRVDALGGGEGRNLGRNEWENQYYGDLIRRIK